MTRIGTVAQLWRYPVKSMRGERVAVAAFDAAGLVGDRRFAVRSNAAPKGKPLVTSRERTRLLLYRPRLEPYAEVTTPEGEVFPLPSEKLLAQLQRDLADPDAIVTWEHSPQRPITDVRPLSLIAEATLAYLQEELGDRFTPERLRSNLVLSLPNQCSFAEEALQGRLLHFRSEADGPVLRVHERIPRCRMVTLDPETAAADPTLLRLLARERQGRVGMYASVVRGGEVREGDAVLVGQAE